MVTGTNRSLENKLILLKKYNEKIDVGLHLVLTDSQPLGRHSVDSSLVGRDGRFHSIKSLTLRAYLGQLTAADLDIEIRAQIESFINIFGRAPDFIDGHQHVQQLPVIRNSLVAATKALISLKYIRIANLPNYWLWNTAQSVSVIFAAENYALVVPGRQASALFSENKIRHNRYLLGYYRHKPETDFKSIFIKYLTIKPGSDDIFFCHPGLIDDHLKSVDSLVDSRKDNLDFLLSAEFEDLCYINKISINRFT